MLLCTVKVVKEWLAIRDVEVIDCPPCSPDSSPIEHAWKNFKDIFHKAYSCFCGETGKNDEQKEVLGKLLCKYCARIASEYFEASTGVWRIEYKQYLMQTDGIRISRFFLRFIERCVVNLFKN